MSECESPASSQVMSSSHSSEGSSIGGFVVVDKCDETVPNPDSSEDGTPAEIAAKTDNLAQAGSVPQVELGERVQNLTKENEELKGVLLQNNKLLEVMFMLEKLFVEMGVVSIKSILCTCSTVISHMVPVCFY